MQRHFTATAFVIDSRGRTLLLWHKRLQRWMPPGGHLDENETPEDAAMRECKEETNLDVEILGLNEFHAFSNSHQSINDHYSPVSNLFVNNRSEGKMLKSPLALLLEEIPESIERGEPAHQHMDFLYVARPLDETQAVTIAEHESERMHWFTRTQIEELNETHEIFSNVKMYLLECLEKMKRR